MPSQSQPLILSFHQMKTVRVDDGLFVVWGHTSNLIAICAAAHVKPAKPVFIRQPIDDVALRPDKARGECCDRPPKSPKHLDSIHL